MIAPTRSRYRPRFLECETAIMASGTASITRRNPAASAVEVRAESLIGQIDERQQTLARKQLRERAPLLKRQVGAAWVVTGRVHEHDITGARLLQPIEHRFEEQPVSGGVVVGIALELQSAAAEERRVIAPGRIAQIHHRGGRDGADEFGADAQRTASPGSLRGPCAAHRTRRVARPEYEGLDGGVVFLAARSRHIGLGRLRRKHQLLGAAHALEHRRVAARIPVDADAEVDLLREGIGAKLRHEPQDLIWLQPVDGLKQCSPLF